MTTGISRRTTWGSLGASTVCLAACSAFFQPLAGPTFPASPLAPTAPPTASPQVTAMASVSPTPSASSSASPTPTPAPASAIASTSIITTLVGRGARPSGVTDLGDGGAGYLAYLGFPNDVAISSDGTLFIGDRSNERIRACKGDIVTTLAGGGTIVATDSAIPAASASFRVGGGVGPTGFALTPAGDLLVTGGNAPGKKGLFAVPRSAGNRYGKVFEPGTVVPIVTPAATPAPQVDAVATAPDGTLYVADGANLKVWAIDPAGNISPLAGNGTQIATASAGDEGATALAAGFGGMASVSADRLGNVYIAETNKVQRIRMVCSVSGTYFGREMAAGRIYTVVGRGASTPSGNRDVGDFGQPSNPTGDPLKATVNGPRRAVFDARGTMFFVDSGNHRVRRVDRESGVVTTVVGSGTKTDASNLGDDIMAGLATLNSPIGLAFDAGGNLLIGDTGNNRVRIVKP